MYKQNLALSNLRVLIWHKTQPNQLTYLYTYQFVDFNQFIYFSWWIKIYIFQFALFHATHKYDNSHCTKSSFIWVIKGNRITLERSNQMTREEIDWLYLTVHVKNHVLGNVFGGTFSDSFWLNLSRHPNCQDILLSISFQINNFLPSYG